MGLFDKRVEIGNNQPLYRIGGQGNLMIVGLGNPGREYVKNRHNFGFLCLDKYQETHDFDSWINKKDWNCQISTGNVGGVRIILVKPQTYMNESGRAVQAAAQFYKITASDIVVVHDELDVEFGSIRSRVGGGSAGHNGIKSVAQSIGEDFGRIRVGIGPKRPAQIDSADFVLQDFSEAESKKLDSIEKEVCSIIDERTAGTLPLDTRKVI